MFEWWEHVHSANLNFWLLLSTAPEVGDAGINISVSPEDGVVAAEVKVELDELQLGEAPLLSGFILLVTISTRKYVCDSIPSSFIW